MPIDKYFSGHGADVLASMKKKHGDKAGTSEFYATANARGEKPADDQPKKRKSLAERMSADNG